MTNGDETLMGTTGSKTTSGGGAPQMHEGDAFCDGGSSPPSAADVSAPPSAEKYGSVERTGDHANLAPTVKLATTDPSQHLEEYLVRQSGETPGHTGAPGASVAGVEAIPPPLEPMSTNGDQTHAETPATEPEPPSGAGTIVGERVSYQKRIAEENNAAELQLVPEPLRPYLHVDGKLTLLDEKSLRKNKLTFSKLFDLIVLQPRDDDPALIREAQEFVKRVEWLGTTGQKTTHYFTLRIKPTLDPNRTLVAVVTMGCPGNFSTSLLGSNTEHMEKLVSRGACISWVPPGLPSWLIRRAVDWMVQATAARLFVAYGDPAAGELGTVYRHAAWHYLGPDFGADAEWHHPEHGKVGDRDLRHVGMIQEYARRASVEWDEAWVEQRPGGERTVRWDEMPLGVHRRIKEQEKLFKVECWKVPMVLKHKFFKLQGPTPQETSALHTTFAQRNPELINLPFPEERGEPGEVIEDDAHDGCPRCAAVMRYLYKYPAGTPVKFKAIREDVTFPDRDRVTEVVRPCVDHLLRAGYLHPLNWHRDEVSVVERTVSTYPFARQTSEDEDVDLKSVLRRIKLDLSAEQAFDVLEAHIRHATADRLPERAARLRNMLDALVASAYRDGVPSDVQRRRDALVVRALPEDDAEGRERSSTPPAVSWRRAEHEIPGAQGSPGGDASGRDERVGCEDVVCLGATEAFAGEPTRSDATRARLVECDHPSIADQGGSDLVG